MKQQLPPATDALRDAVLAIAQHPSAPVLEMLACAADLQPSTVKALLAAGLQDRLRGEFRLIARLVDLACTGSPSARAVLLEFLALLSTHHADEVLGEAAVGQRSHPIYPLIRQACFATPQGELAVDLLTAFLSAGMTDSTLQLCLENAHADVARAVLFRHSTFLQVVLPRTKLPDKTLLAVVKHPKGSPAFLLSECGMDITRLHRAKLVNAMSEGFWRELQLLEARETRRPARSSFARRS